MNYPTNNQKVLIVDDSKTNVQILTEILGPYYTTHSTHKGSEVLDLAASIKPDIILLDVIMPDIDGYEVCRQLKKESDFKNIPVIFISAMDSEIDEAKGLQLGAIDYITKPVSPAIVMARVKNHLELKTYRDLLEKESLLDGLTGIPNRRNFDLFLENEMKRCKRDEKPVALLLIDIDFFKFYNDNYGHLAGDDCLKLVAKTLASSTNRTGDLVARYGGEEFACILPATDLEAAIILAEKMRMAVNNLKIPHNFSEAAQHLTISMGAAFVYPKENASSEFLINKADDMLYKAKNKGRNRVEYEKQ
ncbi:MAG: diguanylate cyclase [Spirochaetia bacterium]|nr:diguanylate cyclase [Spirochaetia bacterium]